jgi:hypothetical protein
VRRPQPTLTRELSRELRDESVNFDDERPRMSDCFLRRSHPVCGATAQTDRSPCIVNQVYPAAALYARILSMTRFISPLQNGPRPSWFSTAMSRTPGAA